MATPRFRSALASLPSWPAPLIALAIMLAVGGYYYAGIHARCTALEEDRVRLSTALDEALANGTPLDLAAALPFEWDSLQVAQDYRPSGRPLDCPFGWGMSREERIALIRGGRYTVLAIAGTEAGERTVEFPGDRAVFEDAAADGTAIPRERAVFRVEEGEGSRARLTLAE